MHPSSSSSLIFLQEPSPLFSHFPATQQREGSWRNIIITIIMDSLEERVSVFYYENSEESDQDSSDYEFDDDTGDSDAKRQRILYWESQQALLQEVLERSSLTGTKLWQEVCDITEMVRSEQGDLCRCRNKANADACNNCLRQEIVNSLCNKGFKASLWISKWSETKKIPRGTHEYIEVIGNSSSSSRKKQLLYVVELEFRDQFEIAKACNEYRNLVRMLPRTYVGKPDCLKAIVRVVCDAAKRSMKESRMHMGPWRKGSFMIMKWSALPLRSWLQLKRHHRYQIDMKCNHHFHQK